MPDDSVEAEIVVFFVLKSWLIEYEMSFISPDTVASDRPPEFALRSYSQSSVRSWPPSENPFDHEALRLSILAPPARRLPEEISAVPALATATILRRAEEAER